MPNLTETKQNSGAGASLTVQARLSTLAKYLSRPILVALLVTLIDTLGLFVLFQTFLASTLVLILFLEAGLGLMVGVGISLSSTPSISRVGQTILGTSPWSKEAERHAERVGWKCMVASGFLFLIALVISVE
jgi:hypothetical protein